MWVAIGIIVLGIGFIVGNKCNKSADDHSRRDVNMSYSPVRYEEEEGMEMNPLGNIQSGAVSRRLHSSPKS